ncbi:MAG: hypothetical protein WDN76_06145 [Alphaproteobacteria bacterium]
MFIRTLSAIAVLAFAAPALASVPSDRLTDVSYLRLSRCAAYATLPAIADDKSAALAARAASEGVGRPAVIAAQAAEQTTWIQRENGKAEKILKAKRDRLCAGF